MTSSRHTIVLAVSLAVLMGCGEVWPQAPRTDAPEGEGVAIGLARDRIGRDLGHEVFYGGPMHWYDTDCLKEDALGCWGGATVKRPPPDSDFVIHLRVRPGEAISDTSIVHELTHWYLHQVHGDGNASHDLPVWDLEEPVLEELRAMGL